MTAGMIHKGTLRHPIGNNLCNILEESWVVIEKMNNLHPFLFDFLINIFIQLLGI